MLLAKMIGLRITQDRKTKSNKFKKYLLDKTATFRSSLGMLKALIMSIDLVT